MHNIFTQLQDLQGKFEKNTQTVSVDKQCQEIIKKTLLPQESDSAQEKFKKIRDCVEMGL